MAESSLVSSCQKKLGRLMENLGTLHNLNIIKEDEILIPKIVVIGDQSSGKTSIIESLVGFSLPRVRTEFVLVIKLEHGSYQKSKIQLEYSGSLDTIQNESLIQGAIEKATSELVKQNNGIGGAVLTLSVKKKGHVGFSVVDLPGLPTGHQEEDTRTLIKGLINDQTHQENCVILNVVSASTDFEACESTVMARSIVNEGIRALMVVSKCDLSAECLYRRILATNFNNGHQGCICVINKRTDKETLKQARLYESERFSKDPLVEIPRSIVGVYALADRVGDMLREMVWGNCGDVKDKIEENLKASLSEQRTLAPKFDTAEETMAAFMYVVGCIKDSLDKILIRGETEYFMSEEEMNCNLKLADMLKGFLAELRTSSKNVSEPFLVDEIDALDRLNATEVTAFQWLLERKVESISYLPPKFVDEVWKYVEDVFIQVVQHHCLINHPRIILSMKKASRNVTQSAKTKFLERAMEMLEMEKNRDQTFDMNYVASFSDSGMEDVTEFDRLLDDKKAVLYMHSLGTRADITHLHDVEADLRNRAFKLNARLRMHWETVVVFRMVDWMALELRFAIQTLVSKKLQAEMIEKVVVSGGALLQEEARTPKARRGSLEERISLLLQAKRFMEGYHP